MRLRVAVGFCVAFVLSNIGVAAAACSSPVARGSVPSCAADASFALRAAGDQRRALVASRRASIPIFPSNPVLAASVGRRWNDTQPAVTNWYFTLSQELELSGQRGARLDAADATVAAHDQRARLLARDVVADAYVAYFRALGTKSQVALATRLEAIARAVADAATAASNRGVTPGLDADLAEVAAVRATQARIAAEARATEARIALANALGLDPAGTLPDATGDLRPLARVVDDARAALAAPHPATEALLADARAFGSRATAYRRGAVPNVTLSLFVQEDGFAERVLGAGIALPIPFPEPIGRTNVGLAREQDALADRSRDDAKQVDRDVRTAIVGAIAAYDAANRELEASPQTTADRAETTLGSVSQEIAAGRFAVRDAVLSQQTLTSFLLDREAQRLALALASVEVARAASLDLAGGER